ncbi:CHASE2 domain-containing protein [Pontixanthobacter sp.]|uniref:CHASE2 domain-containing protein n=1 Tax=Pontixanthobacter sp. TaxID=2792078 RepID=UPI003C7D7B68
MRGRLIAEWLTLLAFACMFAAWSVTSGLSNRIDYALLDLSSALLDRPANTDITIIEIDDGSLDAVGSWPWPRTTHAQLIERLSLAGARFIVMDVLFFEQTNRAQDDALAKAMRESGSVILPVSFTVARDGSDRRVTLEPVKQFADAAKTMGHVALEFEPDGIFRRSQLQLEAEDTGKTIPHMMVATYRAAFNKPPPQIAAQGASTNWPLIKLQQPGHFSAIPAHAILEGSIDTDFIKDQIVLVGATAQGLGDSYPVPSQAGSIMSGVEIQANLLDTLIAGDFIAHASMRTTVGFTLAIILVLFWAFWKLPPQWTLILTLALALTLLAATVLGAAVAGWWLPPGSALLAIIISYPLWGWRRLASVSAFLDRQAYTLAGVSPRISDRSGGGFDFVARQVDRMRKLLSEFSERFAFIRNVIEAAPDAIIVLDDSGIVTMKNQRAADLFGPEEDFEYLPELLAKYDAVIVAGKDELKLQDGRSFLIAKSPLNLSHDGPDEAAGGRPGQIMVLRNVTDLKRKEAERQEMLEFLSHDMRTPQVAIIGLSKKEASVSSTNERFNRIKLQAERTLKLADDFVQLARLSEAPVEKEDIDLCALVTEAADRAYPAAKREAIEIIQQIPADPIFIFADPSLLARVLDNLIGNALKFSPANTAITLSLSDADNTSDRVTLSVADEGPGLSEERMQNPFARFGAHDASAGPSVGLGLAFVDMAVKGHSGTITVKSDIGKGTKFIISLPAEAGA